MRRKLLNGAHEWIGADELIRSLIVWMLSARKISGSFKFVIRRVFVGGCGNTRGGMLERSMFMAAFLEAREVERDDDAELSEDILKVWV